MVLVVIVGVAGGVALVPGASGGAAGGIAPVLAGNGGAAGGHALVPGASGGAAGGIALVHVAIVTAADRGCHRLCGGPRQVASAPSVHARYSKVSIASKFFDRGSSFPSLVFDRGSAFPSLVRVKIR